MQRCTFTHIFPAGNDDCSNSVQPSPARSASHLSVLAWQQIPAEVRELLRGSLMRCMLPWVKAFISRDPGCTRCSATMTPQSIHAVAGTACHSTNMCLMGTGHTCSSRAAPPDHQESRPHLEHDCR